MPPCLEVEGGDWFARGTLRRLRVIPVTLIGSLKVMVVGIGVGAEIFEDDYVSFAIVCNDEFVAGFDGGKMCLLSTLRSGRSFVYLSLSLIFICCY